MRALFDITEALGSGTEDYCSDLNDDPKEISRRLRAYAETAKD